MINCDSCHSISILCLKLKVQGIYQPFKVILMSLGNSVYYRYVLKIHFPFAFCRLCASDHYSYFLCWSPYGRPFHLLSFFRYSFCPSSPIHWLQRLSSKGCSAFSHNFFLVLSALPHHLCVLYYCTPPHLGLQDCTRVLTVLLSGDSRHRVWLNQAGLFTGCCKRADTGHPSGSLEAHKNVLFDFDMAFNQHNLCWKKKKSIFNITETKAFIYFWKHYLAVLFSPFLFFLFLLQIHPHQSLA